VAEQLNPQEQEFLCIAWNQAKDHPQRQALDEPVLEKLGMKDFSEARDSLESSGYLDRGGASRGQSTGGFWITQAGANLAQEICEGAWARFYSY
jgi:hypothetical protein